MTDQRKNPKKKKNSPKYWWLHECLACSYKWDAPFAVKHCPKCGIDERKHVKEKIFAIKRQKVKLVKLPDGSWVIPMRLARPEDKEK